MSVKERILAIRLLEMQEKDPACTKQLGVAVRMVCAAQEQAET